MGDDVVEATPLNMEEAKTAKRELAPVAGDVFFGVGVSLGALAILSWSRSSAPLLRP